MTLKRDSALSRFDLASAVVNGVNNLSLFSCGGRKGLRGMFSVGIQCTQGNNNGDKTAGARRNNLLKIALSLKIVTHSKSTLFIITVAP